MKLSKNVVNSILDKDFEIFAKELDMFFLTVSSGNIISKEKGGVLSYVNYL